MDYSTTTADASKRVTDCAIVGVYDRKQLSQGAQEIDAASDGLISGLLDADDVSSKLGATTLLTRVDGAKCRRCVVVGLGKKSAFGRREYLTAQRAAFAAIKSQKVADAVTYLTREDTYNCDATYRGRLTMQALGEHRYRFNELKSTGHRQPAPKLRKLTLAANDRAEGGLLDTGAAHGVGLAIGMDVTRDLGNLPPNVCTPMYLAEKALELETKHRRVSVTILDEPDMAARGMNSLLSVGHGSEQPSRLIHIDYRGAKDADPVVLVGKGITFDTGGISLKPGPLMDEMKYDMGGAAAVLGTMAAVAALQLPINLTVIVPSAENMPSGRATRPGDIVRSMSGRTIEILNTDAEGRVILCDALTYAQEELTPAALIDVATLTGACVIALGHHRSGLMGNDQDLIDALMGAGERAVDRAWHLPIDQEYTDQLKINFADCANIGGRDGGAITAGAFLGQFTTKAHWAHLDIAGTAWLGGSKKGSTGRPVPLLLDYLISRIE
ncbi:MAG: leucyl aminopeptidase, partial [Pseudomonadota bacterium]